MSEGVTFVVTHTPVFIMLLLKSNYHLHCWLGSSERTKRMPCVHNAKQNEKQ